jgi:hypothetical protein
MKWTSQQIKFLKANFNSMNSYQLSKALGISRTYVRMKYAELGLKKMELEFWNDEMMKYLKSNYKKIGDVELAEIFQVKWPKKKKWKKQHINKKRKQLGLHRSQSQINKIIAKNVNAGGKSFTILKNSSSINLHDRWVAQQLAWRNRALQDELLKNPQLIAIGRAQILLNRELKAHATHSK